MSKEVDTIKEKIVKEVFSDDFINDIRDEKDKEIERLKEQLNDEIQEELKQSEIMVKKQQEIERLNNIINELEKYFEQEGFWHSLDKIKELKEKYEILDKGE